MGWLQTILVLTTGFAQIRSQRRERDLTCPFGTVLSRFVYSSPFDIHANLNRIISANGVEDCVSRCSRDPSCLIGIFDSDLGRCVHGFANATNLEFICAEFRQEPSFFAQKIGELPCESGCEAVEKVCNSCDGSGLNKVIALTYCTGEVFSSAAEVCKGEEQRGNDLNGNSIGSGDDSDELDKSPLCCWWASNGECDSNPFWMRTNCRLSCGTFNCKLGSALSCEVKLAEGCALLPHARNNAKIRHVPQHGGFPGCADLHEACSFWAFAGECERNTVYMTFHCPASCKAC